MTRLTAEMLADIGPDLNTLDRDLIRDTGLGLRGLALASVGVPANHTLPLGLRVAAVPTTCGQGRISGFAESVALVARHLGLIAFVTEHADVAGIQEAYQRGADCILLADDDAYIALNTRRKAWAENSQCTALGYVEALDRAAGGLGGAEVLVIGAGPVGLHAIRTLLDRGCKVKVVEKDPQRYRMVVREMGLEAHMLLEEALVTSEYVLNASPAPISGKMVRKGMVLSNPGVPLLVDEITRKRCKAIVHDPLAIGTAVMLTKALAQSGGAK